MDPAASRALERLRDPNHGTTASLARLAVTAVTATPVAEIADPRWIANQVAAGLRAATRGEAVEQQVRRRLDLERTRWADETRPLRTWVPDEVREPLEQALDRRWSPDQELVFRLLNHPAVRQLLREVLEETLTRFTSRLRTLDQGILGGLGGRAMRKGRGLFGGVAEGLVGAVRDEVEASFDKHIKGTLEQATEEAVRSIARYIADPRHADGMASLRVNTLKVVLDTPVAELVREGDKLDPEALVGIAAGALKALADSDTLVDDVEARVRDLLAEVGDGSLAAWLDELGLRSVWEDSTAELLQARIAAIVDTEEFGAWWAALFDSSS